MAVEVGNGGDDVHLSKKKTLGHLQLRHKDTNEIQLIPKPSSDPNDPLNWSKSKRYYLITVVCLSTFLCTALTAGPSVAIVQMTTTFFGKPGPNLLQQVARTAYFITAATLLQGVGNLFWMPLIVKYGRRPVYIVSFFLYTVSVAWCSVADTYGNELVARLVLGFASGVIECLAPLVITDISFVHQRGAIMALYTASLTGGTAGGIIVSGLITISHSWRYIYYVATALVGATTVLIFFSVPETAYIRKATPAVSTEHQTVASKEELAHDASHAEYNELEEPPTPKRFTFIQNLRIYHGVLTTEPLFKLFVRPLGLLILPPVLWAALVMAVTIGFLVAIASNFATAFATTYGFQTYQAGLCFISALIGSMIGLVFGGIVTDKVTDLFVQRNGGVKEPEMRLPSIALTFVTAPVALVLYGVGIGYHLHWIVPTVGIGLLNLSIVQGINVSFVYMIDSYRPVGGELMVTQLTFKACFGFLLSFYTNPWIAELGYPKAFGSMAAINGSVLLMAIPLYFYGKRIRHSSLEWRALRFVQWNEDREVGE